MERFNVNTATVRDCVIAVLETDVMSENDIDWAGSWEGADGG